MGGGLKPHGKGGGEVLFKVLEIRAGKEPRASLRVAASAARPQQGAWVDVFARFPRFLLFACLNEPSREPALPRWVYFFRPVFTINPAHTALSSNHTRSLFPPMDQYVLTRSRVNRQAGQEVVHLSALQVGAGISHRS